MPPQPGVIFCSFGDMLRVPGTERDLFQVKGAGGDVRVVYSPLDAVELAAKNPDKQVVFFGVGFETTAPANAMSVHVAKRRGLKNFSLLVSHVLVPPAIAAILESPGNKVQGFLLAGHVCSVMGYWEYPPLAAKYKVPLVVTGFEPLDLLDGIRRAVIQLEAGRHEVENAYERIVTFEGNQAAQKLLAEVFEVTDRAWRGIGVIPKSGWRLSADYREFDAEERFQITGIHTQESALCRARGRSTRGHQAGRVRGLRKRMHATASAGGNDGFQRRRLRGVLQLWAVFVGGRAGKRGTRSRERHMGENLKVGARFLKLDLSAAAGRLSDHRDGPRRGRQAGQRAGGASVSAGIPQCGSRKSGRCGGA